ncbi:unnamed protein product [Didymodactylos carnosus]|uniref:Uncharacterized protein n=2 Tax=Didymodactylos carnosus TaxID=1234261 RepID=A0A815HV64_9BILA|nr:unnamed protein product [Didymodactylos carnosus]CAF4231790.1 unnamed protein product [Didymodactylos carnosus]
MYLSSINKKVLLRIFDIRKVDASNQLQSPLLIETQTTNVYEFVCNQSKCYYSLYNFKHFDLRSLFGLDDNCLKSSSKSTYVSVTEALTFNYFQSNFDIIGQLEFVNSITDQNEQIR